MEVTAHTAGQASVGNALPRAGPGRPPGPRAAKAVPGRAQCGQGAAAAVDPRLKARGRAADRVGARIREQRLAAGLTQAAVGVAIGRSRSAIAAYETGRKVISHPVLWAIACVLEIGVEVLFQDGDKQRK